MDDPLDRAPIGALTVRPDGTVAAANAVARDLLAVDGDLAGAPVERAFPRSVEDSLPRAFAGDGVEDTAFEEYYPEIDRWLAVTVAPGETTATVYVDDVTEHRRREQAVERLRAERERVAVIDDLLSDVLREFVDASSREEIAETICSRLGASDRYRFAWVGTPAADGEAVAVEAVAGETGETFPAVRDAVGNGAVTPERRAIERAEPQVVQSLSQAGSVPEPVRMAGFGDGVRSALALPLVYGSSVYGVVGVYAAGEGTFSDHERSSFEALGELAGLAVNATRNRRLLLSDAITEVTFELDRGALAELSEACSATLELDGTVPSGDDALRCFLATEGADPAAVVDAAASVPTVADARAVRENDAGGTVELAIRAGDPLIAAVSYGATLRGATFEDGGGRLVVELPPEGDVREVATALGGDGPAPVLAKRERRRSPTTARELRDDLSEALTERQATALRTAYLADYFESPRESTAEEVASSMGITGSTLLHHLRAAQRKLLEAFYEA